MNNNLKDRFKTIILENNLISQGDKIVVAVSGGPDSMTLITLLDDIKNEFNLELCVAHVNHKIRKESEYEKTYVENYCKNISVPFYYLEKDVISESQKHKMGMEEYARKIRYEFFYKVKEEKKFNKIAVAHNLNDKIETILLNMIRGCSTKGLIGMEYVSKDIIRPLIDFKKQEILDFCEELNINPCIDKTNFENIYTRNKIRLDLIPMIEKEFNPNFINTINRMSELIKEDEEFISEYVQELTDKCIISFNNNSIIFDFSKIILERRAITTRIIRNIINKLLNNVQGIEKKHILDIIKLLKNNITNKKYIIGNKFTIKIIKKNIAEIFVNDRRE